MSGASSIRIGGASGFWGEAGFATRQLLEGGALDFLVYDYLAEVTMSIMARARAKDPALGYATDFVTSAMKPNLRAIAEQRMKVISNAGGVNPAACAEALRAIIAEQGLSLRVVTVTGDDLADRAGAFAETGITEMYSGAAFPDPSKIASINAYLGAFPIAQALDQGADIVITGRCVDSAVTLGACIHTFGWSADDLDLLAAASLAGHIIECGPHATGGNFTDWRDVPDIANIGYPIAAISADGEIEISKPEGTGGLVSRATVAEQMLYEIGDPQAYILPDVTCDFSQVEIAETGENLVTLTGARGYAPPETYKVSATFADGFRAGQVLTFNGFEAREKAQVFAGSVIERTRNILRSINAPDFDEAGIEIMGGTPEKSSGYEEVALKLAVRHCDARAVGLFLKELVGLALATPPGLSMFTGGGRPKPSPVVRLFSFLVDKNEVTIEIDDGDTKTVFSNPQPNAVAPEKVDIKPPDLPENSDEMAQVPLIEVAWARSGDKGDKANIGVIARHPELMPYIWQALDEDTIAGCFSEYLRGAVERYFLPATASMNIVMNEVLGGGGVASLRNDAQGKGYAQKLLSVPVLVPVKLLEKVREEAAA